MKKISIYAVTFLISFSTASVFMSCSSDEPKKIVENQSQGNKDEEQDKPSGNSDDQESDNEGGGLIKIPQEVLEKVNEIYGKASIEPQKVNTVHQLAILTSICATRKGDGPITVTPSLLNGEEVTLVTLGGTEDVEGQATSMEESQQAAFGKPNDYLTAVSKLFTDNIIPQSKPVIVAGISLGGMIAQQLLGQQEILDRYTLRAVITFGSPITLPLDRKQVKVVRFADVHDQVPKLGETILRTGMITGNLFSKKELTEKLDELDSNEKVSRTSKYTGMIETHALSYIEDPCWNDVDFLGEPADTNVLELTETMTFYPAPKLEDE